MNPLITIDDVIDELGLIIAECEKSSDALGYFAALYQKVTIKVKEGIQNNFFDDGPRMEKLDVIFALRYIDAYNAWKSGDRVTGSWRCAFEMAEKFRPIVFQHLLIGMNAHINLDLGIAAAEVSTGKNIDDLEADFNRINEILSGLVKEVQDNLSTIWPFLKFLLKLSGKVDDFMVDFSMKIARNGAWNFAKEYASCPETGLHQLLEKRDAKVARKAGLVSNPGLMASALFLIIRLSERGSVTKRIRKLKALLPG
jgi:hypothetical protein